MSRPLTRRAALRSGTALAAATFAAGCGEDDEEPAVQPNASTGEDQQIDADDSQNDADDSQNDADEDAQIDANRVPGVEGGVVVSARNLSIAHEETLRRRSGRIVRSVTETNRELGESVRTGIHRVDVDGDQVLAVVVGDLLQLPDAADRREVYVEGNDVYQRTLVGDEWDARSIEPGTGGVRVAGLTGRSRLESALRNAEVVGHVPGIEGQFVLRRGGRPRELEGDDENGREVDLNGREAEWFRIHATVDEHGLCHEWGQVADERRRDAPWRYSLEARVDGLLETAVARPAWVDDIES